MRSTKFHVITQTEPKNEANLRNCRIGSSSIFRSLGQKTNIDWDRQANFSQYHTYMWQKSPHPAKGFWDQRIIDAVDKQLQAKGLTKVDSNPDMWVVYSNSIHDQKEVVGTGYNMGPYWGWGGWGTPTTTTYNTWVTKIGTLVVEISDPKQHDLLWRGSATDTIVRQLQQEH